MTETLNNKKHKKRIHYWDNIKGILISLVVLGHFLLDYLGSGYANYVVCFIYFFHMPAFVFVSGFFSKSENDMFFKSLTKLIIIYLIFNSLILILNSFLFESSYQLITPYYSFWYLIALVFWRMTIKYIENIKDIMFISIIASLLVGFWSDVDNVFTVARIIVFCPFFIAGYKLSNDKIYHIAHNRKKSDYLKALLLLIIAIGVSVYFISQTDYINLNHLTMGSFGSIHDLFVRLIILIIAFVMIIAIINLTPVRPMILFAKWGKNSLAIYVLHRFVTFAFIKAFPNSAYENIYILYAFLATIVTLMVLGTNMINAKFNLIINKLIYYLTYKFSNDIDNKKYRLRKFTALLLLTCYLMIPVITESVKTVVMPIEPVAEDIIHNVMTKEQMNAVENSVSIAFVGDLILLQKQVIGAYDEKTGEYDFSPMFEYAKKYLSQADLAIGIFEGPMAGANAGYSTGNYDDGLPLCLNYPDTFAKAIQDSGIDLVSTANNHLLDKGKKGALRTLDILDEIGLKHVGSYRDSREKDSPVIIEIEGIRIGVLSYTFTSNYYEDEYFINDDSSLTSILVHPNSKYFKQIKNQVMQDFEKMKNTDNPPQLIMVIPHMGTQFTHETDEYQQTWNEIFADAGADIILGNHSHAVQPVEFKEIKNKEDGQRNVVIVNCPGNFANSYTEYDGDATAIVEIYIDPYFRQVIAASVIPMYTHATDENNYRALPIYEILNDGTLKKEISPYEMKRVGEVNEIVTSVMLGTKLSIDQAQDKYYLFPEGYFRQPVKPMEIAEEMKTKEIYKLIESSSKICFVGDSITAGSKNGGYGWHEPLMASFEGKTVYKEAWGSSTTKTLIDKGDLISSHKADLYVIAIGTNDVRYRDEQTCAMDSDAYVANINTLTEKIISSNPNAIFVFISPWLALNNDPYTKLSTEERDLMLKEYGEKLKSYSEKSGYLFINANESIYNEFLNSSTEKYLLDHIHPNAGKGINIYSNNVLLNSK